MSWVLPPCISGLSWLATSAVAFQYEPCCLARSSHLLEGANVSSPQTLLQSLRRSQKEKHTGIPESLNAVIVANFSAGHHISLM
jgi:hypothetical protein